MAMNKRGLGAVSGSSSIDTRSPGSGASRGSRRSEQILRAAARLFHDAGYQNVSIEDIGAAVGLTGPAVYRHFKGKHDILVRTLLSQVEVVEAMAAHAAGVGAGHSASATPRERVLGLLRELGDLAESRDEAMLWRRERRHLQPADQEAFRYQFGKVLHYGKQALAAARPGLTDQHAELLTLALLSAYANSREIRGGLTQERFAEIQMSIGYAIVCAELSATEPDAPRPERGTWMPSGRREGVVHIASRLFDQRGFYDVHIEEIAKAAGTSVATLYQIFQSKTEILQAILERGAEGLLYVTAEALALTPAGDKALTTLIESYVAQALGFHGRTLRILATDAIYLAEDVQAALRLTQREYLAEWVEAILALRPGLSKMDARAVAQATIGVITDISQTRRVRMRPCVASELCQLGHAIVVSAGIPGG